MLLYVVDNDMHSVGSIIPYAFPPSVPMETVPSAILTDAPLLLRCSANVCSRALVALKGNKIIMHSNDMKKIDANPEF